MITNKRKIIDNTNYIHDYHQTLETSTHQLYTKLEPIHLRRNQQSKLGATLIFPRRNIYLNRQIKQLTNKALTRQKQRNRHDDQAEKTSSKSPDNVQNN